MSICINFLFKKHPQISASDALRLCEGQPRMAFAGYALLSPCWRVVVPISVRMRRGGCSVTPALCWSLTWHSRHAIQHQQRKGRSSSFSFRWVSIMLLCTNKLTNQRWALKDNLILTVASKRHEATYRLLYICKFGLYSMPVSISGRKYFVTLYRRQLVHAHYHQHIDRAEVSQYGLYSGKWNITVCHSGLWRGSSGQCRLYIHT